MAILENSPVPLNTLWSGDSAQAPARLSSFLWPNMSQVRGIQTVTIFSGLPIAKEKIKERPSKS